MRRSAALLALVVGGLIFSCRKGGIEQLLTASGRTSYVDQVKSLTYLPESGADSVDLAGKISITLEPIQLLAEKGAEISLFKGNESVRGKSEPKLNQVIFTPENELEPLTTYTVNVLVVLKAPPDDSRNVNTALNSPDHTFRKDTVHYKVSWDFTTRGNYKYQMSQASSWVTGFSRDGNKIMQMGEYLYCFGGWTGTPLQSYNDVYRSQGDLKEWERVSDAPWEPRHTYGIGKIDSTLYIFGGDYLSTVFDVWKTFDGVNFFPVVQDLESVLGPRLLYGACTHNSKLYVMGGQSSFEPNSPLTDVWMSSSGTFWKQIATDLPFLGKNISGSVVSYNNRIWVVGGGYYSHLDSARQFTNEVYSSVDGKIWEREPDAPWLPRQYTDVCVWNNRLWIIGGYNKTNHADIWYMTTDGKWHKFDTPAGFQPRHASGVGVYNDKLVIVCGNYHNDCWVIEKQ